MAKTATQKKKNQQHKNVVEVKKETIQPVTKPDVIPTDKTPELFPGEHNAPTKPAEREPEKTPMEPVNGNPEPPIKVGEFYEENGKARFWRGKIHIENKGIVWGKVKIEDMKVFFKHVKNPDLDKWFKSYCPVEKRYNEAKAKMKAKSGTKE